MGAIAYADDLILLAPCRSAAQRMLETCEIYTWKNNIRFSTNPDPSKSKSKALFVSGVKTACVAPPVNLVLCGQELPWVDRCEHLGTTLTTACTLNQDCREKRAEFIDSVVKTREYFNFAHPFEIITATQKYCSAHYSSSLWNLRGNSADMLFASWRTHIKLTWNLPRQCKTFFVSEVLAPGVLQPNVYLMTRFLSFFHSLLDSSSVEVQLMTRLAARDLRSNLGSNLSHVKQETGLDPWIYGGARMREALIEANTVKVPEQDQWRIGYLSKLINLRLEAFFCGDTEEEENINTLINSLVL